MSAVSAMLTIAAAMLLFSIQQAGAAPTLREPRHSPTSPPMARGWFPRSAILPEGETFNQARLRCTVTDRFRLSCLVVRQWAGANARWPQTSRSAYNQGPLRRDRVMVGDTFEFDIWACEVGTANPTCVRRPWPEDSKSCGL